jgi:hypothetical protein
MCKLHAVAMVAIATTKASVMTKIMTSLSGFAVVRITPKLNSKSFGKDVTIINSTGPKSSDVQTIASIVDTSDYIMTKSDASLLMTDYEVAKFDLPHSYKAPLKADRDFDINSTRLSQRLPDLIALQPDMKV